MLFAHDHRRPRRWVLSSMIGFMALPAVLAFCAGCHDGPLYALKHANPYFTRRQWAADEEIGVTDHRRRQELQTLAESIATLPAERQEYWSGHLSKIYESDESPEMRRLAVLAAGRISSAESLDLVGQALDDESLKVRMEACRALGRRSEPKAVQLLAATVGKTQNQDVRHSAIKALANHRSPVATDSLKNALKERDPATQSLVIASLRQSTGKDLGGDPQAWVAALDQSDEVTQSDVIQR